MGNISGTNEENLNEMTDDMESSSNVVPSSSCNSSSRKNVRFHFDKEKSKGTFYYNIEQGESFLKSHEEDSSVVRGNVCFFLGYFCESDVVNRLLKCSLLFSCDERKESDGSVTLSFFCLEIVDFGIYYRSERSCFECWIYGSELTREVFMCLKDIFTSCGGVDAVIEGHAESLLSERERLLKESSSEVNLSACRFVKMERSGVNTYEVFSGPNAKTAKAFLATKRVEKKLYYVIVETENGEGNYGKDIDGIFKEE